MKFKRGDIILVEYFKVDSRATKDYLYTVLEFDRLTPQGSIRGFWLEGTNHSHRTKKGTLVTESHYNNEIYQQKISLYLEHLFKKDLKEILK